MALPLVFHPPQWPRSTYPDNIHSMSTGIKSPTSSSLRLYGTHDSSQLKRHKRYKRRRPASPPQTTHPHPHPPITQTSGKTFTLQNLLTNNDGLRIDVIVNDVVSVNIDQKLIVNPSTATTTPDGLGLGSEDVTELKNGCVCCSLANELLDSVTRDELFN